VASARLPNTASVFPPFDAVNAASISGHDHPSGWRLGRTPLGRRRYRPPQAVAARRPPLSCSSAPAMANAPGLLMLFQVVTIQPSKHWTWEMRNSSIWPLKGSAMPLDARLAQ
jgi:hypothetical protein